MYIEKVKTFHQKVTSKKKIYMAATYTSGAIKTVDIPISTKSLVDENEGEEEQQEGDEEEEEEVFYGDEEEEQPSKVKTKDVEQTSKVKFFGNRVVFETQDEIARNATSSLNDPDDTEGRRSAIGWIEGNRPPYVQKIPNDNTRERIYTDVVNHITLSNARKDLLAQDQFYEFVILVSGRLNTTIKKVGISQPTNSNTGGRGNRRGDSNVDAPLLTSSTTPERNATSQKRTRVQAYTPSSSSKGVESASGPRFSPREKLQKVELYDRVSKITDPNLRDQFVTEIAEEQEADREERYLQESMSWINRDELFGRSQLTEKVYASAKSMYSQIVTREAPHLGQATFEQFVTDPQMQIKFSQIVASDIAMVEFLHATRVQLDKNYERASNELKLHMLDLSRWSFDPQTGMFDANGRSYRANAMVPRGAPSYYREFGRSSSYSNDSTSIGSFASRGSFVPRFA